MKNSIKILADSELLECVGGLFIASFTYHPVVVRNGGTYTSVYQTPGAGNSAATMPGQISIAWRF